MKGSPLGASKETLKPAATKPARLGDVRYPQLIAPLIVLSLLVCAAVLYLTSYKTFFVDEWAFVASRRDWQLEVFLYSHNGHWSTIPILIWKLLFVVVGLRTHIPYEAALLVVHVMAVVLLFTLIRRRSGDLPAFAAATALLVLGSGGENIVWAFQIAWVGSVAFGLLAMLLLDGDPPFPSRAILASVALLSSLMCSSVGLVFAGALGVELVLDPKRRRFLVALAVPVVSFIAWFFAYDTGSVPGAPGVSQSFLHGPTGLKYVLSLAQFVASGLEASAAGVVGLPGLMGLAAIAAIGALVAFHWYRRKRVDRWQIGMAAALLAWFTLAGLGRVQFGASYAAQSRYIYVAAIFLLPLLADAVSDISWQGLWRPVCVVGFALCILSNAVQLRDVAVSQRDYMRLQTAELQTVEVFDGAPDMALASPIDSSIMPQFAAGQYLAAVSEGGSPVPRLTLAQLQSLPGLWVDRVMLDVFGTALTVSADKERSLNDLSCRTVQGSNVDLRVPDGQPVMLRSSSGTGALLSLGFLSPPTSGLLQTQLLPGSAEWVHLPETGKPIVWQLRITTPVVEVLQVCSNARLQVQGGPLNMISADAADGLLGPGWSPVSDAAAFGGRAAKAPVGNSTSFSNDVFGTPAIPIVGTYDVWYRLKVTSNRGSNAEMTLGLWDDQGVGWVGMTTYRANQIGTNYSWLRVASDVTPTSGHTVQFISSIKSGPGTDWYIDEAVMLTAGSEAPT